MKEVFTGSDEGLNELLRKMSVGRRNPFLPKQPIKTLLEMVELALTN